MTLLLSDLSTGSITLLPSKPVLDGTTEELDLAQSIDAQGWSEVVRSHEHTSYTLKGRWSLDGRDVGLTVWFTHGKLSAVTIFPCPIATGWDAWSEQEALRQRDDLDRLLTFAYGSERRFIWGDVDASYDPRSGSAGISVRYRHSQ